MAMPPGFILPVAKDSGIFDSTLAAKEENPQIQLDTGTERKEGYRLAIPGRRHSRPLNLRIASTPPDSPTRIRSMTLVSPDCIKMHNGAITPPATPTSISHSRTYSASSDFLNSLSSLRRGDSLSSKTSRPSLDESARPGSTELRVFPHTLTDYTIEVDHKGRKTPIGVGAWSDVYLAMPNAPSLPLRPVAHSASPPLTPVHSRGSSTSNSSQSPIPTLYAIKVPGSTSAKKVLTAEAHILSYLSRFPSSSTHVVPFYGQDTRTGALVLQAMDCTLESWIQTSLNTLDERARATSLAAIFPHIALSLIDSLTWMQDKDCIHADIKPSNILVSSRPSTNTTPPDLVFSDFSSTLLTTQPTDAPSPMGAGTWDYLDPSLLSSLHPASPSAATDLWSLGITLLFLVLGTSPYDAFKGNKFQQREMIKSGCPLQCLAYDDQGVVNKRRLKALSGALGWDVEKWFAKVLVKRIDARVGVEVWRRELVGIV
jgi:hypothetical protein